MSVLSEIEAAAPSLEVEAIEILELIGRKVLGGDELHRLHAFITRVRADHAASADATAEPADTVPAGSIDTVLEWVGSDPARAQQALDAENERAKPRAGLVADLEALTAAE